MTNRDILDLFFSHTYEKQLNEYIIDDKDFVIPYDGILNYVCEIISVPYSEYLAYIISHPLTEEIKSKHITQSSAFDACEKDMISAMLEEENRGLSFVEIGQHLSKYIKNPNDGSFRKYGENQVKTSSQLGLTYEYFNHWYLNCIGYLYNDLPEDDKRSYMARAILRDPLYNKIFNDIQQHDIDIVCYMSTIKSNETRLRRYDSVNRLIQICLDECKKESLPLHKVIFTKDILSNKVKEEKQKKKQLKAKQDVHIGQPSKYRINDMFEEMPMAAEDI